MENLTIAIKLLGSLALLIYGMRLMSDTLQKMAGLVLSLADKTLSVNGQTVALTKTEFELLRLLLTERGHVLSRQQLIERAWPKGVVVTERTVDVNITRLRKKIAPYSANIATQKGFGYCFKEK